MTQRSGDTDKLAVSTALDGVVVRGERNLLADTSLPGMEGARVAFETFYYAFNTRSFDLLRQIWDDVALAQVYSPPAGLVRGGEGIAAAYSQKRSSPVQIRTVLDDIIVYFTPGLAAFTEREQGTYTNEGEHDAATKLSGRSICIFRFIADRGWRLIYHQVTLGDSDGPRPGR